MSLMKAVFANIDKAKNLKSKETRLEDGNYPLLTLSRFYHFEGHNGETTIAEVIVGASEQTGDKPPAPVGSKRSILFTYGDKFGYGTRRVMEFAANLFGQTADEVSVADMRETLTDLLGKDDRKESDGSVVKGGGDAAQPMRGKSFAGTSRSKLKDGRPDIAKDGAPYCTYSWRPIDQTAADIAKRRAELDKAGL